MILEKGLKVSGRVTDEGSMIELKARNEDDAKAECTRISKRNLGQYVTVASCFGLFASLAPRLHVFAPGDSPFGWYVLNGKVKSFTESQTIADQNATPEMS